MVDSGQEETLIGLGEALVDPDQGETLIDSDLGEALTLIKERPQLTQVICKERP